MSMPKTGNESALSCTFQGAEAGSMVFLHGFTWDAKWSPKPSPRRGKILSRGSQEGVPKSLGATELPRVPELGS